MILMNLYCEKCHHCIGFYTTVETPKGIYCLKCEAVYVAECEQRAAMNEAYRQAVKAALSSNRSADE